MQPHSDTTSILPLHSSRDLWKGVRVEEYQLQPMTITDQKSVGHRIAFNFGQSLRAEWKSSQKWNYKTYASGSFGLVPDGDYNNISWDRELHLITLVLDPVFSRRLFDMQDISFPQYRGVEDLFASQCIASLLRELHFNELAGKLYGDCIVLAFLTHFIAAYSTTKRKLKLPKGRLSAKQLKQVVSYCDDNMDNDPSLDILSRAVNLSSFHFAHIFRNTTGVSPHQYLLKRRIERAIQLLCQRKLSMTQIAHTLGFTDQAHFCRVFKKATAYSPKHFQVR